MCGSGISWAICKFAPSSRQITTPLRQHPTTQFLQAGCPSCRPTNSVKVLKAMSYDAFIADNGIGIGPTFHCHLGLRHQQVRPTLTFDDACYTEQVATVMVATATSPPPHRLFHRIRLVASMCTPYNMWFHEPA